MSYSDLSKLYNSTNRRMISKKSEEKKEKKSKKEKNKIKNKKVHIIIYNINFFLQYETEKLM